MQHKGDHVPAWLDGIPSPDGTQPDMDELRLQHRVMATLGGASRKLGRPADANVVVVPPAPKPVLLGALRPLNVLSVASGMDRAIAGGANPSAFFGIYNQPTVAALVTAVNTLSGEVHTSTNAMGVQASDQFMRVMLDPTAIGRDSSLSATPMPVMALGEKGPRSVAAKPAESVSI